VRVSKWSSDTSLEYRASGSGILTMLLGSTALISPLLRLSLRSFYPCRCRCSELRPLVLVLWVGCKICPVLCKALSTYRIRHLLSFSRDYSTTLVGNHLLLTIDILLLPAWPGAVDIYCLLGVRNSAARPFHHFKVKQGIPYCFRQMDEREYRRFCWTTRERAPCLSKMSDQDLSPHHDGGRGATKPR
jgi:hypothetical protein